MIKRFSLLLGIVLSGCSSDTDLSPTLPEYNYPYTISGTDSTSVVLMEKGSDPLLSFYIKREKADTLEGLSLLVNGKGIQEERIIKDLEYDQSKGYIIDAFRVEIPERGPIKALLKALYSGKEYKSEITYKYE